MSETTKANWGMTENEARQADLAEVRAGRMTLAEAQQRAKSRRSTEGLRMNSAASAVLEGQQMKRRADRK